MFNDPQSDLERERKREHEKFLRDSIAKKPEYVAEQLFRTYHWAQNKAAAMRIKMREYEGRDFFEKADMYEQWMLRYMAIEVQALSGLAAVSPEIRQQLAKG